jgi:hypothetical protein
MAVALATLGQFRLGTTEYAAGRARSTGEWHLVRKQYGNDSSSYSYARFTDRASFLAARANPDAYTGWQDEPFSTIDYTLLLLPLATPLPASTATGGAMPSVSGRGDSAAMVEAVARCQPTRNTDGSMVLRTPDSGEPILVKLERATTAPSLAQNAATETTLAKVLAQLAGTLSVGVNGAVSIANPSLAVTGTFYQAMQPVSGKFWQDTQPVSGAVSITGTVAVSGGLTDGQLRAAPVPVSLSFPTTQAVSLATAPLPTGAATSQAQADQAALLNAINTKLGGSLTVTFPTTQAISAAALPLPTGASTAALQATGNGYLQTLASAGFTATVVSGPVTPYSLVAATGNNATLVKTGATQLTSLTVTNATASYKYLMLYNLAAAPGTGATPLLTLGVPGGQSISLPVPGGKYVAFSAGLAFAVGTSANLGTLVAGLLGTTGVTAADMVVNLTYA